MNANDILLRHDLARLEQRFNATRDVSGGPEACWPWVGSQHSGLMRYGVFRAYAPFAYWVTHRMAWVLATRSPIEGGLFVLHRCDNPACCNPKHLFLGTHAENQTDKRVKGRQSRGEANHSRFTEAQVLAMRADPRRYPEIAASYGTNKAHVGMIKRGLLWTHVGGEIQPNKRRGVHHRDALLDPDKVRDIRTWRLDGPGFARLYGVSLSVVYSVRNRKTWRHVL